MTRLQECPRSGLGGNERRRHQDLDGAASENDTSCAIQNELQADCPKSQVGPVSGRHQIILGRLHWRRAARAAVSGSDPQPPTVEPVCGLITRAAWPGLGPTTKLHAGGADSRSGRRACPSSSDRPALPLLSLSIRPGPMPSLPPTLLPTVAVGGGQAYG